MADERQGPDWKLVIGAAAWRPRDSQGEFVYRDQLWILGGWYSPNTPNPRDVWKSADGRTWSCVTEEAPWEHSDLSPAMVFRDRMWLMGGRKLPGAENSNKVWSSADGAEWTLETDDPGWCPRVSASFAVFNDRMWIMGGTENFYDDNDRTLKNDRWSTADGREWRLETRSAPWAGRTHARAVVFEGKLWIMGGGRWHPRTEPRNDVWCSEDGVSWAQVTASAPWAPRLWFALVVYRGRMWVLGGWSREHGNFGDLWYSSDGASWTELRSNRVWSSRHEPSAVVFRDRIWVYGGYADELKSDVWTLELPEGYFSGG